MLEMVWLKTMKIIKKVALASLVVFCCLATKTGLADDKNYFIHPGDKLNIQIYREKDLSGTFTVDSSGKINFPLLGEVYVDGLSVSELKDFLTKNLGKSYIRNPQIQVDLIESESKSISILGQIVKPGNYILASDMSLMRLISQVGGFTAGADQKNLRIVRTDEQGNKQYLKANMDAIIKGEEEDVKPLPGDIIFVDFAAPETKEAAVATEKIVTVLGQVARPGNYAVDSSTTFVKLIGQVGGFTNVAAQNRIKIVRHSPPSIGSSGKKVEKVFFINAKAMIEGNVKDIKIEPGDVIFVPETYF